MKKASLFAAALVATAMALPAFAQKEKIVVEGQRVVELKDGGAIVIGKDGKTYHTDAAGKRARMKDNVIMVSKDGDKYLMRNDAIWKQITDKGTIAPNR